MAEIKTFGMMKVKLSEELTVESCQKIAMVLGFPAGIAENCKKGMDLLGELETRGHFHEGDTSKLTATLKDLDLLRAAAVVERYKPT